MRESEGKIREIVEDKSNWDKLCAEMNKIAGKKLYEVSNKSRFNQSSIHREGIDRYIMWNQTGDLFNWTGYRLKFSYSYPSIRTWGTFETKNVAKKFHDAFEHLLAESVADKKARDKTERCRLETEKLKKRIVSEFKCYHAYTCISYVEFHMNDIKIKSKGDDDFYVESTGSLTKDQLKRILKICQES